MVQKKVPWLLKRETKHELVKCTKFLQCLSRESTGEGDQWDSKSQIHTVLVNVSRHCTAACVCLCVFYICPQAETERWHLTTVLKGRGGRWFPQWAWKAAMFVLHCLQKWNRHAKKKKKNWKTGTSLSSCLPQARLRPHAFQRETRQGRPLPREEELTTQIGYSPQREAFFFFFFFTGVYRCWNDSAPHQG